MHYAKVLSERIDHTNGFDYDYISDEVSIGDWRKILRAATIAENSKHRFRIGAVVVRSRKPIATSCNEKTSHPLVPPYRFSFHAEAKALSSVQNPKGTTVYVARLDAFDKLILARPCLYCISLMLDLDVDRVVFSSGPNACDSFHLSSVKSALLIE